MIRKLIITISFLLISVKLTLFLYLSNFQEYYCSENSMRWLFLKEIKENKIPVKEARILFLGDSRLNTGIKNEEIKNSYMLASGGATSIEMYYLLRNFIKNQYKPDTVFLSLSPRSFVEAFAFWNLSTKNEFFKDNEMDSILKYSEILDNNDLLTTKMHDIADPGMESEYGKIFQSPRIYYLSYKWKYIGHYQPDMRRNIMSFSNRKYKALKGEMMSLNGRREYKTLKDSCSELNFETGLSVFRVNPLLDHYFKKILKLCKEEGIFVIFDFMPMNESSENSLKESFIADYEKYIESISKEFDGFSFSDTMYFYKDYFFGDPSHLNEKGMLEFTEYIKNRYFDKTLKDSEIDIFD